jgi:hypothetical protein
MRNNNRDRSNKEPRSLAERLVLAMALLQLDLLLHLLKVDMGDSVVAIEDAGNLLEGGALGLDVEEVHEEELAEVPEGVEEHEVPVLGHILPSELVGLASDKTLAQYLRRKRTGNN